MSGYAANNSRALERRRSSVSEYVLSQDDEESGGSVASSDSRRRRKGRRHVLTQESYEAASEGCRQGVRRTSSLEKYSQINSKLC